MPDDANVFEMSDKSKYKADKIIRPIPEDVHIRAVQKTYDGLVFKTN